MLNSADFRSKTTRAPVESSRASRDNRLMHGRRLGRCQAAETSRYMPARHTAALSGERQASDSGMYADPNIILDATTLTTDLSELNYGQLSCNDQPFRPCPRSWSQKPAGARTYCPGYPGQLTAYATRRA